MTTTTGKRPAQPTPAAKERSRRFPFYAASTSLQREFVGLVLAWFLAGAAAALSMVFIGVGVSNAGVLLIAGVVALATTLVCIVVPSIGTHPVGGIVICAIMLLSAAALSVAIPLARPWLRVVFPVLWAARAMSRQVGLCIGLAAVIIVITGLFQGTSATIMLLRLPSLLPIMLIVATITIFIWHIRDGASSAGGAGSNGATGGSRGGDENAANPAAAAERTGAAVGPESSPEALHAAAYDRYDSDSAATDPREFDRSAAINHSAIDRYALISHDLRVPLTSIIGYISLELDGDRISDETRSHLDIALRNAERLNSMLAPQTMVNRGLGLAEDAEKTAQRTDIIPIINEVLASFGWQMNERGIRLRTRLDDSLIAVADEGQIRLLLSNLVSNAVKYNKANGSIFVSASTASGNILVEISDSGVGIPHEELDSIRSMYYRASNAKGSDVDGSGIGLYTCDMIVRRLHGSLDITSEPGKGTTITVRFPSSPQLFGASEALTPQQA